MDHCRAGVNSQKTSRASEVLAERHRVKIIITCVRQAAAVRLAVPQSTTAGQAQKGRRTAERVKFLQGVAEY
jgi:hypothetical protein